jgi:pimeloyl-ACP methyl ester carboxylesterase
MKPLLKELRVLGRSGFYRMAYAVWGSPRADRTVICLHGLTGNGRDFDVLAAALAEQGARVVVPDLPGRGRSEWLASPVHYTDDVYANTMSTLIARLDVEEVDWIGTSLGGHVGMLLAAGTGTPVRSLVLNDYGARISAEALRRIGAYLAKRWRFGSIDEVETHLREVYAPFGKLSDKQWLHLAQHAVVDDGSGNLRFHFDPGIAMRFAVPIFIDVVLWHLWDKIQCPVFILRGAESKLLSAHTVQEMLGRGPAAEAGMVRSAELAECGHAPALMDETQVALIKDFLFQDPQDPPAEHGRTFRSPA